MTAAATTYRYAIDGGDSIAFVDSAWLEFARANGAPELTREAVLGRSLWDFVSGPETKYLYRAVLERVRDNDTPVILPFRCDSSVLRRHMRLVLSPLGEGRVRLEGVLVREEPRPPVDLFDPGAPRSNGLVGVCSWCKRVRVTAGEWAEVEDAIARMDLFRDRRPPQLTHGICEPCDALVHGTLRNEEAG